MRFSAILIFLVFLVSQTTANKLIISDNDELKPIVVSLPPNYSVHASPPLINGKLPVAVEFSILLFNVFDVKEMQGELSLECNLKLFWKDTRLANWTGNIEPGEKYTILNPSLITKIWHPDVFIDHMKNMAQPSLISKAASLRIYPDGSLRYSARMLIVVSCLLNFYYYPADTQKCSMDIKSYGYSTKHITLGWKDGTGAELAYPIEVHNFNVALTTSPDYIQRTRSANYSGIRFNIFLQRKLSYHIIQTFIPSALFTIVSWLSFLVPPESTPGRMALCVTTLLTLTAMFAAVRQNTPSVSYIKALDIWMVACIIFVFSVLAEYTTVLKLRSMRETKRIANMKLEFLKNDDPLISRSSTPAVPKEPGPTKYFLLACKIEKYAPRIMPVVFLLFNCIYWPYLLLASDYYKLNAGDDMYYSV